MDLILQLWGGGFYLANKILFAFAEGKRHKIKRRLKVLGWLAFIIGVPAWIIILIGENDWMVASVEAGALPAMFLGLYNTFYENKKSNKFFNKLVSLFTYTVLLLGVIISVIHYGGIVSISQVLELLIIAGFLLGAYLLAKNNAKGWLFFILMNLSTATLMLLQDKHVLMAQQLVSLIFVMYGYVKSFNKEIIVENPIIVK